MFFRPLHTIIKQLVVITGLFLLIHKDASAQHGKFDTLQRQAIVYEGDTIELKTLTPYYCYSHLTDAQRNAKQAYDRLRNAVYVTYPYARRAGIVMNDINAKLANITGEAERKKYIHSREKELRKEFTKPLTDLSIYQGKVLMKLINRETGNNCYEIIKEYQGGVTARVYQTVAFFFSTNLKQAYNAKTDDLVIERFVLEVQRMYGYTDIKKVQSL
ncbi:MAG: DUF4294 domain-containing protein [Ferruginibacter sp.]